MRGYNVNPILLLANFKARENANKNTGENITVPGTKEQQAEKEEQPNGDPATKPPVVLAQQDVLMHNNAIQPSTAWLIVSGLILILIVLMVLDARSRVSRLEAILFEMLRERG